MSYGKLNICSSFSIKNDENLFNTINTAINRKLSKNTKTAENIANKKEKQSDIPLKYSNCNKFHKIKNSLQRDILKLLNFRNKQITVNPLFDYESKKLENEVEDDFESSLEFINNFDFINIHEKKDYENSRNNFRLAKENQMICINGKRYWNFHAGNYHTFGGIGRRKFQEFNSTTFNSNQFDEINSQSF